MQPLHSYHFFSGLAMQYSFAMGSQGRKLHVFFFPLMAHGHMIPIIDIATLFSIRGLKSSIITTPVNASNISSRIKRLQDSGLDINIVTIPFPSEEVGLPKGCEHGDSIISQELATKFFIAVAMLQQSFEQLLEEMHPDCVVSDSFLPWTNDAAARHGIPRLVFHGTSLFSLSVSDSLRRFSAELSDSETFVVPGLPDEIKMKKSQLIPEANNLSEMMDENRASDVASYGVLVNSFYELESAYAEHYRKVMGTRAWVIGPVSLTNSGLIDKAQRGKKAATDEHNYLNWLDSKDHNSVIYVSFGSVSRFSGAQLIEIAEGLEASGVSFIWVLRTLKEEEDKCLPDGFEERMEGKGLVVRDWAPQVLILDHPAIGGFMTHCGWNSLLEGISAGLPMITWPLFAEQFQNEALITQVLKIGIKVGVEVWNTWTDLINDSIKKDRVEKVVIELMKSEDGEEMRKRARGLKEMAKKAVEEGGSSYTDLTALIEELHQ